jgi:hypothetical protein
MASKAQAKVAAKPADNRQQTMDSTWTSVDDMPTAEPAANNDAEVKAEGLPPGIKTLKMWGRTVITWGKAARNSTYAQVVEAAAAKRDDPVGRYAKWVLAQSNPHHHPGMRDLQLYLNRRKAEFMLIADGNLFFPGSDMPRVLAVPSDEDTEHDEEDPDPHVDECP